MTTKKKRRTREELLASLQGFDTQDPARNRALEEQLWQELGAERAIFVSDLSGFTRVTKTRGILHFLAIVERARDIGTRMFERHGGRFLKTQADDLFALFDTAGAAAACARAVLHEAEKLNATLADPDAHVHFCIGIGFGRILELADDAFGDEINVAFKLGEDLAVAHEILVSDAAAANLRASPTHRDLAARLEGPLAVDAGHVQLLHWRL